MCLLALDCPPQADRERRAKKKERQKRRKEAERERREAEEAERAQVRPLARCAD